VCVATLLQQAYKLLQQAYKLLQQLLHQACTLKPVAAAYTCALQ
jgi:hypothetical protein